ncbi:MAG: hypothetical protein ACI4WH_05290 [Oscillospiraceae bacterium]
MIKKKSHIVKLNYSQSTNVNKSLTDNERIDRSNYKEYLKLDNMALRICI